MNIFKDGINTIMKLEEKKRDLVRWSNNFFSDTNSLNFARKAGEALCKIIIISSIEHELAEDIIYGRKNKFGREKSNPKIIDYYNLINVVCNNDNRGKIIIGGDNKRKEIKVLNEIIRTYTNVGSHDPNKNDERKNISDEILVALSLSKLIYWLYNSYLQEELPKKIKKYILKYLFFKNEIIIKIKQIIDYILEKMEKYCILEKAKIKNLYDWLLSLNNLNFNVITKKYIKKVYNNLMEYNQLPRKPGNHKIFKKFIEEKDIRMDLINIKDNFGV